MSGFDVRFSPCAQVGEMVVTDQTQKECASEHGCVLPEGARCPLGTCFAEVSGLAEGVPEGLAIPPSSE